MEKNINRTIFFKSFKFNEQCMGHNKITCILLHTHTKHFLSKEPNNAFVMNINT